jgi:O-antigen ligase
VSSHAGLRTRPLDPVVALPPLRAGALLPFALGIGLAAVSLVAKGGTELGAATKTDIAVTLVGAAVAIVAILFAPTPRRRWGVVTLGLLAALAAWTALSITWSVNPADSWMEANLLVSYVAAFGGAIALARLAPERGRAILTAVLVACLTVSVIALFEKAFPAAANSTAVLARLREPLGYWNALGLLAAMAVPPCLWLGARRDGPAGTRALAYPLLGLALVTLVFAFSRGSLLAMALGVAFWFAFVPLRLRGLVVLGVAGVATIALSAWAFSQDALSQDRQPLSARIEAGHELALLLALMLIVLLAVGVLVQHFGERYELSPKPRRNISLALLCAVALAPFAGLGALALSERGLTGSISHAFNSFFSTTATSPGSYGPDRLASTGSKRGAYWGEAQKIWSRNRLEGAGAGGYATARLRYRADRVEVRHAHGYVAQTAADLGLVGVLISLAGLIAWAAAAWRASRRPAPADDEAPTEPASGAGGGRLRALSPTAVRGRARELYAAAGAPREDEPPVERSRLEMLTLVTVVLVFGLHSAIDWTWVFPGTGLLAVVCAGYVAGHGPPGTVAAARSAPVPTRIAAAVAVAIIALVAAWAIWQPQRAQAANEASVELLANDRTGDALVLVRQAISRDPVSADPLFQLAQVQAAANRPQDGLATLQRAVRMQPQNPDTWRELAAYQSTVMKSPSGAYASLRAALALDPRNPLLREEFVATHRQLPRGKPGQKPSSGSKQPATAGGEVARCREQVRKIESQLRSGSVPANKVAKRRAKLARCKAVIREAG